MTKCRTQYAEKLRIMRAAQTTVNYKYGMGGLPKTHKKPITLATVRGMVDEPAALGEQAPKQEG